MKRFVGILALLLVGAAANAQPIKRPHLVVEPSVLEFGESAGSGSFTISNQGNLPLELKRVAEANDAYGYRVANDPGEKTLQPGESVHVTVTYQPSPKRKQAFGGVQVFSND